MTPQTFMNDLKTNNCDPGDIVLLVIGMYYLSYSLVSLWHVISHHSPPQRWWDQQETDITAPTSLRAPAATSHFVRAPKFSSFFLPHPYCIYIVIILLSFFLPISSSVLTWSPYHQWSPRLAPVSPPHVEQGESSRRDKDQS